MSTQTNEKAFESYLEVILTTHSGWQKGSRDDWDRQRALFPRLLFEFIADTQPEEWESLKKQLGDDLELRMLEALEKELNSDSKGMLHVLRRGFKFYGKTLRVAYFKPAHDATPELMERYAKNRLTVTRQVLCHPLDNSEIDLVFAVNGLPVATTELKNPGTGQNWRHAVEQYKTDRNPNAPLFQFKKRALVHFAADVNEVHMTTRLREDKTFFLPFNRGSHPGSVGCGAGNPLHASGYRTGYFWQETLHRDSFLDILRNYLFLQVKKRKVDDGRGGQKEQKDETMIFPRYHQLDSVRNLLAAAKAEKTGHNYLIQHSAGSGKTNSISWLAHHLSNLHDENQQKVFDCVIVISDRQVLDTQLQEAVYQIEHEKGVVKPVSKGTFELAEALVDGTKIVITTLQKFPFVLQNLLRLAGTDGTDIASEAEKSKVMEWQKKIAGRHYAIIADEAHSSQSGEAARTLKEILGDLYKPTDKEGGGPDWEDNLNRVMESRRMQKNISFFAFTATPKGKTLQLFGRTGEDGKPAPFCLYSMRQAIEEGFILDVVQNYTTYSTFFKLAKTIDDDPDLPKDKARKALTQFLVLHPHNLEQKTQVIIEHFQSKVRPMLDGRAKAMVVADSRLQAVRFMNAFKHYLEEHQIKDIRPLIAFSGTVKDKDTGEEYTESGMNLDCVSGKPISAKQLPERFASPDYHILLVADKYQTGFDQPLLCAMYVNKRLDGVQAVQTLSRLNRKIPGKQTPFVLDFVNKSEDIYTAFKPYYDVTSLQETSDPHRLEELKAELDKAPVLRDDEIEAFAKIFYKAPHRQASRDHAAMMACLSPAEERFRQWEDEELMTEFRDKLKGYVNLYSFLSQIMPYCDPELEKLYSYGTCLLPLLGKDRNLDKVMLGNDVELRYYRLQRTFTGGIDLGEGEAEGVKSPTAVGSGKAQEQVSPLSELILVLNERFGTDFTEQDRLFFEQIQEKATSDDNVIQLSRANSTFENFKIGLRPELQQMVLQRHMENDGIVTRYMEGQSYHETVFDYLAKAIYLAIRNADVN